jgi:hypothetical protein
VQNNLNNNNNGTLQCPHCGEMIRVGTAGMENLKKQNQGSKVCKAAAAKKEAAKSQRKLLDMFSRKAQKPMPPTARSSCVNALVVKHDL